MTICRIRLYADDTVLHLQAKTKDDAAAVLSRIVVPVVEWLQNSHLHFNPKKNQSAGFPLISDQTATDQPSWKMERISDW